MPSEVSDDPFLWLSGQRALDFLNTEPVVHGHRVERLASFERLVAWCAEAELLASASQRPLLTRWVGTRAAARTLALARALRAELRLGLERRAGGRALRASHLETLNACLALPGTCAEVRVDGHGALERRAHVGITRPEQLLRPIAEAAAELLCDVDPGSVRRCDNPSCVLYFYDDSKNRARRWCSMRVCGNRAKVAAHVRRRRAESPQPTHARLAK